MSHDSPLLSLVRSPAQLGMVVRVLTTVVGLSFAADKSRVTQAEQRRRCELCVGLFRTMRECGYSTTRALDEMPVALRARLDGGKWEPSTRTAWAVNAGPLDPGVPVEVYSADNSEEADRARTIWTPERARLGIVD